MAVRDRVQKVRTWFMFLNRYLREMAAWILEPHHTWLLFLALAVAFVVVVLFSCREPTIRLVGLALQLAGFVIVAWELSQARKQFGRPTILGGLVQWLARRPRFGPKHEIIGVMGVSLGSDTAKARGRVLPGPDTPLDERVAILQQQYESLFDEVGALDNKLDQNKAELSKRIDNEAAARQEADARNQQQLEEATVGGLHLDWVGVTLFVLGTITGSASVELSSFLVASCSAA
jgi:hypothetical protein